MHTDRTLWYDMAEHPQTASSVQVAHEVVLILLCVASIQNLAARLHSFCARFGSGVKLIARPLAWIDRCA